MTDQIQQDFRDWMRRYGPLLLETCQAFSSNATEAEDLLQDTWIVALKKHHFRPPEMAIGAWLHGIALNLGRSRARRRERRRRLLGTFPKDLPLPWVPKPPPDIRERVRNSLLWDAISNLPDLQKRVLLHRVVDELSTAETASILGKAEGTVKASLHRAVVRLERILKEEAGFEEMTRP